MLMNRTKSLKIDWFTVILFLLLVGFGWVNITSASASGEIANYLDTNQPYGKQMVFIVLTFVLIIFICFSQGFEIQLMENYLYLDLDSIS